jgi:hypothetical protein
MKKNYSKYLLEFIVIVLGISVSFYWEARVEERAKNAIKNQSLQRIVKNIDQDILDLKYNYSIHQANINASKRLVHLVDISKSPMDSIAIYLNTVILSGSFFSDNNEEYHAMRNSGLIEKISNDEIIEMLQKKYSEHHYIKFLELEILNPAKNIELRGFLNANTNGIVPGVLTSGIMPVLALPKDLIFPANIIPLIKQKRAFHEFFLDRIGSRIVQDSLLRIKIIEEID